MIRASSGWRAVWTVRALMVHYDPSSQTARDRLDDKSGGHRRDVVGRSNGGNIVMMRCTTRSERSEAGRKDGSAADDVAVEVEAMGQMARALAMLPDAASRARVLRWAIDRYQVDLTPTVVTPIAARPGQAPKASTCADPMLEVESLDDLFALTPPTTINEDDLSLAEPATPAQGSGVESMIRSFAADFRRFALEWQGA